METWLESFVRIKMILVRPFLVCEKIKSYKFIVYAANADLIKYKWEKQ